MVLTNVMPRYGTREHQRLGILLVALLVLAVCMLMPSAAFAAFDGTFKPDTATQNQRGHLVRGVVALYRRSRPVALAGRAGVHLLVHGHARLVRPVGTGRHFHVRRNGDQRRQGANGLMGV